MSFWMGIALVQGVALPGYLLVRALGLDRAGPLQTAIFAFGFSLVLNHFLVVVLVLTGAYTRPALAAVVLLECGLLAWLARRGREPGPALSEQILGYLGGGSAARLWLLVAALAALAYLAGFVPRSFTSVFEGWDAVLSWNRWANDWASGRVPIWTSHYPQLVPTSWSLFYVLQGTPQQFLAHGTMALYPLGIVLVFFDLGLRRREPEPLVAAVAVAVLMGAVQWIGLGGADLPVAFFGLLAFYPLLRGPFGSRPGDAGARLAAATLAAVGAALAKQPGVWVAAWLPLFAWRALAHWPAPRRWRALAAMVAGLAAGILPWYGYTQLRIAQGVEPSEFLRLTHTIHHGLTLLERAAKAFDQWQSALPGVLLYPGIALVLLSLALPAARWTTLALALPWTLLWALFFSYDTRNVALALPFLALALGHASVWLCRGLSRAWTVPARRPLLAAAGAVGVAAGLVALARIDFAPITAEHDAQLALVGQPPLNEQILEFQRREGFDGKILTNYRMAENLPGLRELIFFNQGAPRSEFWPYSGTAEAFSRLVDDPGSEIRYLLVAVPVVSRSVRQHVLKGIRTGRYEVLFEIPQGSLLRVSEREPGG